MSGQGSRASGVEGAQGLRLAIVAGEWHALVTDALVDGALRAIEDAGATADVVRCPGAFELPLVAKALAESGYDAVVALGVVIRGGTPHFEYVSSAATDGLLRAGLDTGVPIGFGVLTCDDDEQARDRSGLPGAREDKGREAAEAAMATAVLLRGITGPSGS
ncbi:MAG: 6,7-dimethyl-8-ribityllumazine synthase [Actinobacteria bacterium]|nr:6,7-dimethyl-8-ribityllumazine synthase [Actinomycetota bacterium]